MPRDDDFTVEADDDVVSEIRRIAQEARDRTPPVETQAQKFDPEATIDGSDDLNEIRRMAAAARAEADVAPTPHSPDSPPVPPLTVSLPSTLASVLPSPPPPTRDVSPAIAPRSVSAKPAATRPPDPATRIQPQARPVGDQPAPRESQPTRPQTTRPGTRWQPPSRMLAPNDPPKDEPKSNANYQAVAVMLAALLTLVVVLVVLGVVGEGSGSSTPGPEGDVPAIVDQAPQAIP